MSTHSLDREDWTLNSRPHDLPHRRIRRDMSGLNDFGEEPFSSPSGFAGCAGLHVVGGKHSQQRIAFACTWTVEDSCFEAIHYI